MSTFSYSGFVPTCCRWTDVLRLLYQLPLSCDGWCLGPWAWSFLTSRLMFLLEMIISWHCNWTLCECACEFEQMASATLYLNSVCNNYVKTPMYLWCELLCNMWCWPLNLLRFWLGCEFVWNPSRFHGLPGYTDLSWLNSLRWRVIFLLNFV
jgi:hypothetical protein